MERTATDFTLLIVEDDQQLKKSMARILQSAGFSTIEAESASEAQALLKSSSITVDMVVADFQMPGMSGFDLFEWTRRVYDASFQNHRPLPFVLTSGFENLYNDQCKSKYELNDFLKKPFDSNQLISLAKKILEINDSQETLAEEDENHIIKPEFCKVSLEDFVSDNKLDMDVFVQLRPEKFIKVSHQGEAINVERIQRYKEKGLKHLYIRKEDFRKVLDFNIMLSKVVTQSNAVCKEKKARFLAHTGEVILENAFVNGVDEAAFRDAKDFLACSIDVLTEDPETFSLLEILNSHADFLYAHSLGVSMYSVLIAKKLGIRSTAFLFKLSFGGLMHDIGKKEFHPELLLKPRSQLSYSERKTLESHPLRGKEILESLKAAPSEVVAICYEHHENALGQGFPRELPANRIHPMAKIVQVADLFCGYALKGPNNPGVEAPKAIRLMETYKKDQMDVAAFAALKEVFKLPSNLGENLRVA